MRGRLDDLPMLGDVLIDVVLSEDLAESSSTTDHALEDGEQITDHVNNDPIVLNIEGFIRDSTDQRLLKLRNYREKGKLLSYNYRNRLETVLITSFNSKKDVKVSDGYTFTMTLKQVRLARAPNIVRVSAPVKKQLKTIESVGKKQIKKTVDRTPKVNPTTKNKPTVPDSNVRRSSS